MPVHELSDCDEDGLEAVLAASNPTPPSQTCTAAAAAHAAAAAAPVTMNLGHQRAALELRNLTLEREASVPVRRVPR